MAFLKWYITCKVKSMSNIISSLSINNQLIVASDTGEISNYKNYWTNPIGNTPTENDTPNMPYDDGTIFNNKPINFIYFYDNKMFFVSNDGTIFKYENESFQDISISLSLSEEITSAIGYFSSFIIGTNLTRLYSYDTFSNSWDIPEDQTGLAIDLKTETDFENRTIMPETPIAQLLSVKQNLLVFGESGDISFLTNDETFYAPAGSWISSTSNIKYAKEGFNTENVKTAFLF